MPETKKCVISTSGGLDSTSLLLHRLSQGYEVRAYAFKYGQKHAVELKKIQHQVVLLAKRNLPVTLEIIDLTDVFGGNTSALVASTGKKIPVGESYNANNMADTVVPLRNVIFSAILYSKALNWAIQEKTEVEICLGIHGGDHFLYPDCRPESQEACRKAFAISDDNSKLVTYEAPFLNVDKTEVLRAGIWACVELGLDWKRVYKNTISCYNPDENGASCGECSTCKERLEAFKALDLKDPAVYV